MQTSLRLWQLVQLLNGSTLAQSLVHDELTLTGGEAQQVDQLVLFPDILSASVVIEIERLFHIPSRMETGHIVYEMGEDYLGIVKSLEPFGLPFKGDERVVIDR